MVQRWRSEAWARGESKRARGMGFWGSFIARARVRRGRQELSAAVHGDVEVALEAAGRVARPRSSSARQQEGEEVVRDAWVPAHGVLMAGMAGKASAAALSVASAARTEQGGGRW